ncbi:TetR/AcrR family transcriptional regulator [Cohnella sp. AR92]|uniref:TetR/AcrR family transcriptional regulator n=1 Tax=Cohnella sp. AR92 TaxID=648716 RepID=UPI000F8D23FD|nr:TetR/AcrR family transcriptional regulator [Cohnella sp. AR92]RUS47013.1 TetR/AcrR family transcriptional regulator [Cohnella sp. AR92]
MARHKEFDTTVVLSKAMYLFWKHGYEGTSIQDLVNHVGIKAQSLYNAFGGKRELFLAALRYYADHSTTVRILDSTPSGKEAIATVFREVSAIFSGPDGSKGCFLINSNVEMAPHDAEIADFLEKERTRAIDAYYRALTRAKEQGELHERHQDLMALARYLSNAQGGLAITAKTSSGRMILDDIVRVTLSILD